MLRYLFDVDFRARRMATLALSLTIEGWIAILTGLATEFLAFFAMKSWHLRQRLPVKSPITLQSAGCMCFCLGVVLLVVGNTLLQ